MADPTFPRRPLWTRLALLPLVLVLVVSQGWERGAICVAVAALLLLAIIIVPERLDIRRNGLAPRAIRLLPDGDTEHGRLARTPDGKLRWTSLDGTTSVQIEQADRPVALVRAEIAPPRFDVALHTEHGRSAFRISAGRRRLRQLFHTPVPAAPSDRGDGD